MAIETFSPSPDTLRHSTRWWLGAVTGALAFWTALYSQLIPFSNWVVAQLPIDPKSHLGEAVTFFAYDTPKVLLLLTLVVFAMGVVRSFFSPASNARVARRAR